MPMPEPFYYSLCVNYAGLRGCLNPLNPFSIFFRVEILFLSFEKFVEMTSEGSGF